MDEKEKSREYRKKYRAQPHVQAKMWEDHLKEKYGINSSKYDQLLADQDGGCAICGRKDTGMEKQKRLHVDHSHKVKRVRGILCKNCNTGLGCFFEAPELLFKAIKYLVGNEEFEDEH